MRHILSLVVLFVAVSTAAFAQPGAPTNLRITAGLRAMSCSSAHVQLAIDTAVARQTVVVPNGSCTWATGVSIPGKAITLAGETQGGVTLIDNLPDGGYFIAIGESTSGHVEVKNLTFDSRTSSHVDGGASQIRVSANSGGRAVLLHHNTHLLGGSSKVDGIHIHANRGVIYLNTFTGTFSAPQYLNGTAAIRHKLREGVDGLAQWESASTLGTLDTTGELNLYVEQNTCTGLSQATDFDDSSRIVFRYNTFMDCLVLSHGYDSSPYGSRQVEIYGNAIDYGENTINHETLGPVPMNVSSMIGLRGGGVWRIWGNQIADPSSSGSLWGSRSALLIELYTLRGNPYCETGSYPIYHQHGRGHNGTSYILDPIRIWGNTKLTTPWVTTGAGDPIPVGVNDGTGLSVHNTGSCRADGLTTVDFVQLNRDFYLSAPVSGYAPYTYPHPLRR